MAVGTHAPGAGIYSGALRRRLSPGPNLAQRIESILYRIALLEQQTANLRNHAQVLMLRSWNMRRSA